MESFPGWLKPMAATLTQQRFNGPEWAFERKLDGIRLLAFKQGADVRLLSRNRLLQNAAYPAILEGVRGLPLTDAILDGEATGVWGHRGDVAYHVFDLLWLEGRRLTTSTLEQRRRLLEGLPLQPPLHLVERLDDEQPWQRACDEGWEGVIAKRRDAPYEHRRSPHWLKMKCEATQELVVGGFTDPQRSRAGFGSLLVGFFRDHELVFAGKVGTGFDTKMLLDLRSRLDAIEVQAPPFARTDDLPRSHVHWVRPELVVQVAFLEWTPSGKMRHPRLLGMREDKSAGEVVRES